jgi:plasmid replication initiation protein
MSQNKNSVIVNIKIGGRVTSFKWTDEHLYNENEKVTTSMVFDNIRAFIDNLEAKVTQVDKSTKRNNNGV